MTARKRQRFLNTAYLGMGSNMGDRKASLIEGLRSLEQHPWIRLESWSSLYETEPVDRVAQRWFMNIVAKVSTNLDPIRLLRTCQAIERKTGRIPASPKGPRVLDIDLLFFNRLVYRDMNLTLPHPRLHERAFVLVPMAELDPDFHHPVTGHSMIMLKAVVHNPQGMVHRIKNGNWYRRPEKQRQRRNRLTGDRSGPL